GLFRLRYLKRIPEYSTATVRALSRSLYDKDAETRWRSAYAFSRWPEPRAIKSLLRAARQRNRHVRLFALRSLTLLGEHAPFEAGRKALQDKDYKVRAQAVTLLGEAGRADLIPKEIAEDKSAHVRAAAANALSQAKGDMSLLAKLAEDASPMVRGAAILSLAKRRRDGYSIDLEGHAKDSHWWVRSRAMLAAARLKRAAFNILETGLADADIRVRAAAVEALGARRGRKVLRAIANILNDPDAPLELRGAAVEAAGRQKTLLLLEPLEQAYENSRTRAFVEVREGVVDAASALAKAHPKDPRVIEFRKRLLQDSAQPVRAKAARALGLKAEPAPPPTSSPFLLEAPAKETSVVLETDKGKVVIELFCEDAPIHCANILSLARKGTYNGTPFHRVVTNFVVQGGDPRGTGWGDAGYSLRDEINRRRFNRGTVGMPKAGKDTGGAQIFITHVPTPHLDGRYTVFGKVVLGMYIVDQLEPGDLIQKAYPR
ncbi:MAG: peptidylprolyl isomerase, partial [Elusimicrobiota bacterium]